MQQPTPPQPRPTPPPQQPAAASSPSPPKPQPVLSSDMIQSYLDQNQLFLAAIVDSQAMGKLQAAMEYQIKLQQNLLFLASLADQTAGGGHAQPSTPAGSGGQSR